MCVFCFRCLLHSRDTGSPTAPCHAPGRGSGRVGSTTPQHDRAQIEFCIKTGGGATHTIEFGKDRVLPRAVFGAANDGTATDDVPSCRRGVECRHGSIGSDCRQSGLSPPPTVYRVFHQGQRPISEHMGSGCPASQSLDGRQRSII